MLLLILFIMFVVTAGFIWREGLWGATLTLLNFLFAGMWATNYFEPLASQIDKNVPRLTYFWDFVALWSLFVVVYIILRIITGTISRYRVEFNYWVEMVGRSIVALWMGWLMVSFTLMTLHTAPLPRHAFGEKFQKEPFAGDFMGMAPDRKWLAFIQSRSRGALRNWTVAEFDPQGEFIIKYGSRRQMLEDYYEKSESFSVP